MQLKVLSAMGIAIITLGAAAAYGRTLVSAVPGARTPAPGIFAAGRLDASDVERIAGSGIRHVIDLTLDAETPEFDEAAAVQAAGVGYSNLPLRGAVDLTREHVLAFDALLQDTGRPVLVHCSSGNRAGAMAALRAAWVQGKPVEDAIAVGKAWGLAGLEAEVRDRIVE